MYIYNVLTIHTASHHAYLTLPSTANFVVSHFGIGAAGDRFWDQLSNFQHIFNRLFKSSMQVNFRPSQDNRLVYGCTTSIFSLKLHTYFQQRMEIL